MHKGLIFLKKYTVCINYSICGSLLSITDRNMQLNFVFLIVLFHSTLSYWGLEFLDSLLYSVALYLLKSGYSKETLDHDFLVN